MNIKEIKEMIQLMNENNLTELELEKDGLKIKLKKNTSGFVESSDALEAPLTMPAQARGVAETREAPKVAAPTSKTREIPPP